jgi:hypothetical protein
MSRPAQRLRGVAIKFPNWCEKMKYKIHEDKNLSHFYSEYLHLSEYMCYRFWKLSEGLERKSVHFGRHILLNVYSILKLFSLRTFGARKCTRFTLSIHIHRVFRAQVEWTFILPPELPTNELRHLPKKCCRRFIILLSMWCLAAAFFLASCVALSQVVPTVKWVSEHPVLTMRSACR